MTAVVLRDDDGTILDIHGPFPDEDAADYYAATHEERFHRFNISYEPMQPEWQPTQPIQEGEMT